LPQRCLASPHNTSIKIGGRDEHDYTLSAPPAAEPAPSTSEDRSPAIRTPITSSLTATLYLPLTSKNELLEEFRGIWVSRFDWTSFGVTPTSATLDTLTQPGSNRGPHA
jgi:hypothetical protein